MAPLQSVTATSNVSPIWYGERIYKSFTCTCLQDDGSFTVTIYYTCRYPMTELISSFHPNQFSLHTEQVTMYSLHTLFRKNYYFVWITLFLNLHMIATHIKQCLYLHGNTLYVSVYMCRMIHCLKRRLAIQAHLFPHRSAIKSYIISPHLYTFISNTVRRLLASPLISRYSQQNS